MRHEVLYQYDLPIEILDDIPRTEEVLNVIYARSKDKYLIPILFTRLRMLWGYPERQTVYRIYEMHYIDLLEAQVRFPVALAPTFILKTVNNDRYIFHGIKNTVEEMRAALLTLREMMLTKAGGNWEIVVKRNLLMEEYLIKETGGEVPTLPETGIDDVFEDDVFEKQTIPDTQEKELDAAESAWVSRMIESTDPVPEKVEVKKEVLMNDAVVFNTGSGKKDDQWFDEGKGDALILPGGGRTRVGSSKYKHLTDEHTYTRADDDSVVYVSSSAPKITSRPNPRTVSPVTLEPRAGLDDEAIDKSLDALRYLRENGIITEDEYKKRCLVLFKKTGL